MKVRVYWNLHRACWSVQDAKARRIIGHATQVLIRDASFNVYEAGRLRVIRERKKNVHAFVVGELEAAIWSEVKGWHEPMAWAIDTRGNNAYRAMANSHGLVLGYSPYAGPHFVRKDTDEAVTSSPMAYLTWENRRGADLTPKSRLISFDPCNPELHSTRLEVAA